MNLRWFTPTDEVNLCGHGTLAAAHILKERRQAKQGAIINFKTLSGTLSAVVKADTIELDFPSPDISFDVPQSSDLLNHLGLKPVDIVAYGHFDSKVFIEVKQEEVLLNLVPNFDGLKKLTGRGIVITCQSLIDTDVDFKSRYFAPWVGVNEDPVTGSAHCALTVYWAQKLNQKTLKGYQASARGGYVGSELLANGRIKLIGSALTTINGKMEFTEGVVK